MGERGTFERLLTTLHAAALDDADWPSASGLIDEALRVQGNTMAYGDIQSGEDILFYFAGVFFHGQRQPEMERQYFQDYYLVDERVPRVRALPDGELTHSLDLYTEKELTTSPVYNEYLDRVHAQNGIHFRLDGPCGSSILWIVHDPVRGGDWSSNQLDSMRRLLPHLRQYVRIRQALAGAGALGASLMELLDANEPGIIQLDQRGRILEMNDHARGLLGTGDGLFDRGGFLFARQSEDNAHLQGLLKHALFPFGTPGVSGTTMVRRERALPLVLHVNPVDRRQTDLRVWPVAALVLIVDPAGGLRVDPVIVGATLGLTKMESQVAVSLAEGMNVREIAASMGRKESTIRSHVKQTYTKLGLSRRVDLLRLVLSLAGAPKS